MNKKFSELKNWETLFRHTFTGYLQSKCKTCPTQICNALCNACGATLSCLIHQSFDTGSGRSLHSQTPRWHKAIFIASNRNPLQGNSHIVITPQKQTVRCIKLHKHRTDSVFETTKCFCYLIILVPRWVTCLTTPNAINEKDLLSDFSHESLFPDHQHLMHHGVPGLRSCLHMFNPASRFWVKEDIRPYSGVASVI